MRCIKDEPGDLRAQFVLFEDGNNLAFTESGFLHVENPFGGVLYFRLEQIFEWASISTKRCEATIALYLFSRRKSIYLFFYFAAKKHFVATKIFIYCILQASR